MTKKNLLFFIIVLFIFSLLYKLGAPQLKFEEPRRTIVALEMIRSGDYIHPTIYGEDYYKKPPVFNWLIASSYLITGVYTGFSAKIVTVFFYLIFMYLTYLMGSKYVSRNFGGLAALLVGVSSDMYFSFSDRAEIDIFYSTITLASIYLIFYFGEKKSYWPMYLLLYLLSAVGFLTKGIPSLLFPVISVSVYFFYNKKLKKIFHPAHFIAIFLFVFIIATYGWLYADGGDLNTFVNVLFLE
jgi:4-amino-4-deoxy-L-arabinose transferase-like glycosyltransferase